jgi:zinc protease
MNRTIEQIKNASLRPESAFRDTVTAVTNRYHFRARPMTENLLKEVNLDKLYEFYKDRFADVSDFTFFLVGNFTVDKIKPLVTKYIGGLTPANRKENWKDVGMQASRGAFTKAVYKGIEPKSSVRLVINGDFEWTPQNRYNITALKEVFNIKLREVLREDKGGVYGVGAGMYPTQYPRPEYSINIGFGCSPDRVDELITAVKDVIKEMKENKPADSYIQKVKEIQKREREVNLKQNNYWISALYQYYFNNEDPRNILF